jgi:hypothetical protein
MSRRPTQLRPTSPDELPAPRIDPDSAAVLTEAIDALASIRTPYWLGDTGVHLHALTSLHAHAQQLLPDAVAQARDQGPHLARDRPAARHHSRNRSPPLPDMNRDQLDQDHRHNAEMRMLHVATAPAARRHVRRTEAALSVRPDRRKDLNSWRSALGSGRCQLRKRQPRVDDPRMAAVK